MQLHNAAFTESLFISFNRTLDTDVLKNNNYGLLQFCLALAAGIGKNNN